MTLRRITQVATAVLGSVTLLGIGVLLWTSSALHRITLGLEESVRSVRAAAEIELRLQQYARLSSLAAVTGKSRYRARAERVAEDARRWHRIASRYITTAAEASALEDLAREMDEYFAATAARHGSGVAPAEAYLFSSRALEPARQAAKRVRAMNVEQSIRAERAAARWDARAYAAALLVIGALVAGVAGVVAGAERLVFRFLRDLRRAIQRFAAGQGWTGVDRRAPLELQEIAAAFDELVARLAEQRQRQLEFIGGVAHDLRNPLSAIKLALASVTHAGGAPPERIAAVADILRRQVDLLARMISDLLESARIEGGRLELRPEHTDLRTLASHSVELFRHVSGKHQLTLQVPDEPVTVRADGLRIEQVINNLVSNAIKYSPGGGPVRVAVEADAAEARVAVSDTGIGIAPEEQPRVFEPFRRGGHTREAIPGVGLGLAVAQRLVRAHGGTIRVQSTPGQGSTFTVCLPHATGDGGPPAGKPDGDRHEHA